MTTQVIRQIIYEAFEINQASYHDAIALRLSKLIAGLRQISRIFAINIERPYVLYSHLTSYCEISIKTLTHIIKRAMLEKRTPIPYGQFMTINGSI